MGLGLDFPAFFGQLVSFLILVVVLSRFGYRPIRRVLDERAKRIRESVEEADATKKEYERARAEAEQELRNARQEAHKILVDAGVARDRLLQEARAEAQREAASIAEETRARLEEDRKSMVEDLRRRFADGALAAAESIVARHLDAAGHNEMIVKALDEHLPIEEDEVS
jgi:F-type H+-transporting ATPase subunit b